MKILCMVGLHRWKEPVVKLLRPVEKFQLGSVYDVEKVKECRRCGKKRVRYGRAFIGVGEDGSGHYSHFNV